VGPVTLSFNDGDPSEVIATCIRWQSARYRGARSLFRDARHRAFLAGLADAGICRTSSLRAGNQLLATHVGFADGGRFYYSMPAYEPGFARYSPGRLLFEHLLEETFQHGFSQLDLLIGREPYKWIYATHARLIGPIGRPPLLSTAGTTARRRLRLGTKLRKVQATLHRHAHWLSP
jgi:CelD/BcsL family acetyltransferase involved in cellulose biosynthesis